MYLTELQDSPSIKRTVALTHRLQETNAVAEPSMKHCNIEQTTENTVVMWEHVFAQWLVFDRITAVPLRMAEGCCIKSVLALDGVLAPPKLPSFFAPPPVLFL
ncbi:unnamed protein product [Ectocarpus sp. 12 AP-2014]